MKKIYAIAVNTFREAIRNRILYSILAFSIFMIGSSYLLAQMQVGGFAKVLVDVGMASISFFGVMIAIFLGVGLLNREIERKTIYTVISKPVSRGQFILGKFFGLNLTLLVNLVVMLIAFYAVIALATGHPEKVLDPTYLKSFLLILSECYLLIGLAVLFGSFSSTIMTTIYCVGLYIVGHLLSDIKFFALRSESDAVKYAINALYYILPNLETFNIKEAVSHDLGYSWTLTGLGVLYSFCYTAVLLLIGAAIFARRDYK